MRKPMWSSKGFQPEFWEANFRIARKKATLKCLLFESGDN
jgi:hypothetical protein